MEERRRFVRWEVRLRAVYRALPEESVKTALTRNLSGGGLCFATAEVLPPGTRLQAEITVPEREEPIPFTAEVMWSETSSLLGASQPARTTQLGVRFVEIAPEDQEALMQQVAHGMQTVPGLERGR